MNPKVPHREPSRWSTILTVLLGLWLVSYAIVNVMTFESPNQIAVIPLFGVLTTDGNSFLPLGEGSVPAPTLVQLIEDADANPNVKGIILEINSPGGTVVASRMVADAVRFAEKPVTALIQEIGTSGAFWVASAADVIVADPLSITGSIGVISSYLEFSDLMKEYGVTYEQLMSGEYKDAGSPYRKLTPQEKALFQAKLDRIHAVFIEEVAKNRGLEEAEVRKAATGLFYLGEEALELRLVDYLGGKELAVNLTKDMAGISEATLKEVRPTRGLTDILERLAARAFFALGQGLSSQVRDVGAVARPVLLG